MIIFGTIFGTNHRQLVMVLPEGVMLTVVMDCCHSGSILDLPYNIKADEGTIHAVEAGEQSSVISANPGFDLGKVCTYGVACLGWAPGTRGSGDSKHVG